MIDHSINQVGPRMIEALERDVGGFAAARAAWSYALAVERLNADIATCNAFVSSGDLLSGIVRAESIPSLNKRFADLDIECRSDWEACCAAFSWTAAKAIDRDGMNAFSNALAEIVDFEEWALQQARLLDLSKNSESRKAFVLYSILLKANPGDEALLQGYRNANQAALENLERDLSRAKGRENIERILDSYRSVGLDIPRKDGVLADSLKVENDGLVGEAEAAVDQLLVEFPADSSEEGLLQKEDAFFEIYFKVHTKIGVLDQTRQTAFKALEDRFSAERERFELNVQLADALKLDTKKEAKRRVGKILEYAEAHGVEIDSAHATEISSRKLDRGFSFNPMKGIIGFVALGAAAAIGFGVYTHLNEKTDTQVVTVVEVENDEVVFAPIVAELVDIVDRGFSVEREERADVLFEEATVLAEARDKSLLEIAPEIVYYRNEFELLRQARARELQIIADYWIEQSSRSVKNIGAIQTEEELAKAILESREVMEKAVQALSAANELDGDFLEDVMYEPANKLYEAQDRLDALEFARNELLASERLTDFFGPLKRIHSFEEISDREREEIGKALRLETIDKDNLLPQLISDSQYISISKTVGDSDFFATPVVLDAEERSLLEELVSSIWIENVYVSEARYYNGGTVPLSTYLVYTAEPIRSKPQSSDYAEIERFRLREFGANGRPNTSESSYALIDKGDHGKYGHSFSPSELSAESTFFNKVLQKKVSVLLAGGPRESMLELLGEMIEADDVNAVLRTYWLVQLNEVVSKNPEKWGLGLSPEISSAFAAVSQLKTSDFILNDWLALSREAKPAIVFDHQKMIAENAKARAAFAATLTQGDLVPLGYVDISGELELKDGVSQEELLWSIDPDTGKLAKLADVAAPPAYSPVIGYRNQGRSASGVYEQTDAVERAGLSLDDYKAIAPSLFKR